MTSPFKGQSADGRLPISIIIVQRCLVWSNPYPFNSYNHLSQQFIILRCSTACIVFVLVLCPRWYVGTLYLQPPTHYTADGDYNDNLC